MKKPIEQKYDRIIIRYNDGQLGDFKTLTQSLNKKQLIQFIMYWSTQGIELQDTDITYDPTFTILDRLNRYTFNQ